MFLPVRLMVALFFKKERIMKLYTQREAAEILGYAHYRSLNKLIADGKLQCIKRHGKCGRKLFTEKHLNDYINSLEI